MGVITATLIMLAGQSASVPASGALAARGKWTVDYEPSSCVVSRSFGDAEKPVVLGVRQSPMGEGGSLVLIFGGNGRGTDRGKGSIQIGDEGQISPTTYTSMNDPKTGNRITQLPLSAQDFAALMQPQTLTIVADGAKISFAPTAIDKAIKALQSCTDQLLSTWGVDPDERTKLATRAVVAKGSIEALGDQYPGEALRVRAEGRTLALLSVDKAGKVSDCKIVSSSGNEALDRASCNGAVRIRFTPAIAKDGSSMASHYMMPFNWMLPR